VINYLLILSAVINSVLIMYVIGPLSFLLFVSVVANIVLAWYTIQLLRQQQNLRDDITSIFTSIESFLDHLESIHQLEAFYGDEKLQSLIQHSRRLVNDIIDLQVEYDEDIQVEVETYDDEEEENKD
tara:strand:- start:3195 stop:3575 length:381 start_codon:yes stop_codon:yes gene_type:complete